MYMYKCSQDMYTYTDCHDNYQITLNKCTCLLPVSGGKVTQVVVTRPQWNQPTPTIQHTCTPTNTCRYNRGVARILGRGVLSMRAQSARVNFSLAHLRNGKVEVQIITENAF